MKTELNSKNRITAMNTLAIPVVTYSFNVVNWNLKELKKLDTKIRKQLTCNRRHHPKSDVARLYIPRRRGGRGMIQLELSYKTSTIGLCKYLENTQDWMLKLVNLHEQNKKLHSITKESHKFSRELELDLQNDEEGIPTVIAKKIKQKAKEPGLKKVAKRLEEKPLHGKFVTRSKNADFDELATHQWLRSSELKKETEGFILAAQDQSLLMHQANVIHSGADPKRRFCNEKLETIDHLVSVCSILSQMSTKSPRQNWSVSSLEICSHYSISTPSYWYEHHPDTVSEGKDVSIVWDFPIHTDNTIQANRPDIVIIEKRNNTCLLIDMSVPSDNNVAAKLFEKLSKYKDLEIEVEKMWHLKTTTIPVVVGALGLIKKGTNAFIEKIPGSPSLQEVQKVVLNSTAHVLRRALSL